MCICIQHINALTDLHRASKHIQYIIRMHYLKALGKTVTVKIISLRHINLFTKHMIDLKIKYY